LKCIDTWRQILPDYEIKEWNEDNFDYTQTPYTHEAYMLGKYAFVSDVARLYALLTEGGIYLDTDVRVLKSFDPFLDQVSFIGMENPYRVSTAVLGSMPNVEWVSKFYESYKNKHFIRLSGQLRLTPNTEMLSHFLDMRFPFDEHSITRYDIEYFCAKIFLTKEYRITNNTVAVHEFSGSWLTHKLGIFSRLRNICRRVYFKFLKK
jgi:hypothetical protein